MKPESSLPCSQEHITCPFPVLQGTQRFIIVFTRTNHLSLCWYRRS